MSEANHHSLLEAYEVCKFTVLQLEIFAWLFGENTERNCLISPTDSSLTFWLSYCWGTQILWSRLHAVSFCHYLWFIFPMTCQTWVIFNPVLGLPKGIISYLLTLHMISQSLLSYPLQIPCISLLPLMWCQLLFLFHNKSADLDNLQPLSFFQTICMNTLNRISRSNKSFRASVVIFSFAVDCSGTQFYGKIWFGWFTLTCHFISQSNIWKKVATLLTVRINHLCTFQM